MQLLDTLKHAACVSLNRGRRRGLIFLSGKVLVLSWAKRKRFVGRGTPSHSHLSSSPKSPDGYRFAILALTVKLWLAVLCARLLKGRWLFVGLACCHGGSPIAVPPQAGPTATAIGRGHLSVSQSGAFPNCATRFRGGALRHAKFPKTSYKVQLLDTLKHGRCVGQNSGRGRGLIFLSDIVLVPFWQNASVLLVLIKTLLP